jgi:hypothetical protein
MKKRSKCSPSTTIERLQRQLAVLRDPRHFASFAEAVIDFCMKAKEMGFYPETDFDIPEATNTAVFMFLRQPYAWETYETVLSTPSLELSVYTCDEAVKVRWHLCGYASHAITGEKIKAYYWSSVDMPQDDVITLANLGKVTTESTTHMSLKCGI